MQLFVFHLFFLTISAFAFPGPKPTPVGHAIKIQPQGWSPQPTKAPLFKGFLKRQSNGFVLVEGPDPICGYQYGSSLGALGLCGTSSCAYATSGTLGDLFCYDQTTTTERGGGVWTSCVGNTLATSCLADSACANNPGIIICTGTESLCNLATWVGLGFEALWCDSTAQSGIIPVYTTYSGQIGRDFITFRSETTTTTTTPKSTPTSSAKTDPNPISSLISTTTITPGSTTSPGPPSSPTSPTHTPTPGPHTPVGAIVGGLIGGIAVLAAIAAGIFFCLRSRRNGGQNGLINEIADAPPPAQHYAQEKYQPGGVVYTSPPPPHY